MTRFSAEEIQRMQAQAVRLGRGPELERVVLAMVAEVDSRQVEEALARQRAERGEAGR